ncbi:hypothetical protein JOM56_002711, partial [Amanita muscaria]
LSWLQWAQFFSGWLAWSCDAIDFFLGFSQHEFLADRTEAITLTLLLRTVGALFFGIIFISDFTALRAEMAYLIMICGLAVGFVHIFPQFLGTGGIRGLAAATALETLPTESRGLAKGLLQQGYACGYLLATSSVTLGLEPNARYGWRSVFWVCWNQWVFCVSTGHTSREPGFNLLAHGSQDLYPSHIKKSEGFDQYHATVTIIGNCVCGQCSDHRFSNLPTEVTGSHCVSIKPTTITTFLLLVGAFVPLWILPSSFSGLSAGAFFLQFNVQEACSRLNMQQALSNLIMSPPAFLAAFPSVAYQLGNMISAEAGAFGTELNCSLTLVLHYVKVQGIFIGVVAPYVVIVTIPGPEYVLFSISQEGRSFS